MQQNGAPRGARAREEVEHATHYGPRKLRTPAFRHRRLLARALRSPGRREVTAAGGASQGTALPTLGLPVLAGAFGEQVDSSALRFLTASVLEAERKLEEEETGEGEGEEAEGGNGGGGARGEDAGAQQEVPSSSHCLLLPNNSLRSAPPTIIILFLELLTIQQQNKANQVFLFCVAVVDMSLHGEHDAGPAVRRRQRRLRQWLRHERMTVAMALAQPFIIAVMGGRGSTSAHGHRTRTAQPAGRWRSTRRTTCSGDRRLFHWRRGRASSWSPGRRGVTAAGGTPQGKACRCHTVTGEQARPLTLRLPSLSVAGGEGEGEREKGEGEGEAEEDAPSFFWPGLHASGAQGQCGFSSSPWKPKLRLHWNVTSLSLRRTLGLSTWVTT